MTEATVAVAATTDAPTASATATGFRPGLLVPCFNHGRQLEDIIDDLMAHDLPCLLIDDGSSVDSACILDTIAARHAQIELVRLPANRGKGAACAAGIEAAATRGWTHALQIDADGQHDPATIPELLACARARPDALVSGRPVYDQDIPRVRYYGRFVSYACVWLETLSFAIRDPLCGLRVYPVAASRRVFERKRIGRGMEFDADIMVRLQWAGTPPVFVDTSVRYPAGGVSHFAMVRDNLRMIRLHVRLLAGMALRLPGWIVRRRWRRHSQRAQRHWSQHAERGSYALMCLALGFYRLVGRRGFMLVLYPLVTYFFATRSAPRKASREFLQCAHEQGGAIDHAPRTRDVFRHMLAFGHSVVDRLEAWRGRLWYTEVDVRGRAALLEEVERGRGVLLLTSHLGNVEMCRALNEQMRNLPMNVLVYHQHARRINGIIARNNPESRLRLIDISDIGAGTAARLKQQIDEGEFVAIAGDRTPVNSGQVVQARFLGADAPFPTGPFIIASLLRCPVYMMTCTREHHGGYRMDIVPLADRVTLSRRGRDADLQHWVQRYADNLAHHALRTPFQWFNFYDFWDQSGAVARHASGSANNG